MADQNIALGVQVPDSMKSISGMLNFATQAQNLRQAQQTFQRGDISLQKERELLRPQIEQGKAESETAQTGAKSAKFKLQGDQAAKAMEIVGGMAQDPRIKGDDPDGIIQAGAEMRDRMIASGVPKEQADWQASQVISRAHQPGAAYQLIQNAIRQNSGAQAQAGVINAPMALAPTGGALTPVQLQPGAPGGMQPNAAPIPLTVPVTERQNVTINPITNSPTTTTKDPQGNVVGVTQTPTGGGVPSLGVGDAQDIPVLSAERTAARNILSAAPIAHTTNQGILEEIDKVSTGSIGPKLQGIFSTLGIASDSAEARASAYDLVGKYLERNAIEAAKAMGPNTNAGLEAAVKANGSVAYNPTAIKKLTKLNDAIVSGAEAYQPGLEKAIAANPQLGVLAKRAFDQAWAQNFDPKIYMIEGAVKRGDKATVEEIKKQLGQAGVQELVRKAGNLERLSAQGRL